MTHKAFAKLFSGISAFVICSAAAMAQQANDKVPVNPIGVGAAWSANVDGASVTGRSFDDNELALIEQINTYFNEMWHLQGRFVQTDWQNQRMKGRFFVRRPGRFRFIYSPPSKLVILSDGRLLSIEDYATENVERYPLSSTPFRLLLGRDVNLLRDARIVDLYDNDEVASITLEDKSGDATGRIKLSFSKDEGFELSEWTITDAQGLNTRIQVADLVLGQKADPNLFRASKIGLPGVESNR